MPIKQIILSAIRCENNQSLPQAGNDETESIREHTCEEKWGGLHSRIYALKQVQSTCMKQKNLPQAINQKIRTRSKKSGTCVASLSAYNLPQSIALGGLQLERPNFGLWGGAISSRIKEGSRRYSNRGRVQRTCSNPVWGKSNRMDYKQTTIRDKNISGLVNMGCCKVTQLHRQ